MGHYSINLPNDTRLECFHSLPKWRRSSVGFGGDGESGGAEERGACVLQRGDGRWEGSSQNHRMFGVGRDLCGSSSPTPCRNSSKFLNVYVHAGHSFTGCSDSKAEQSLTVWLGKTGAR